MRRRLGLFLIFGAAIPLVVAASAWACAALATLRLDTRAAAPGTEVSGVGRNYSPAGSFVTVRLGGRKGPVLWEGPPAGSRGNIRPTFEVPAVKPGSYVIVATQSTATGAPVAGTPGRAALRITRTSAGSSQAPASSWASPGPSGPGGPEAAPAARNGDAPVLPALMGVVLSLALLGSGLALVGRARAAYRPLGATTPKSG